MTFCLSRHAFASEQFFDNCRWGAKEVGGFAKIKTLDRREEEANPDTLVLDGGDFSMGTLIQTVYDTEAAELRMLGFLGYDGRHLAITNTITVQRVW